MDVDKKNISLADYASDEHRPKLQKTIINEKLVIKKELEKISSHGKMLCCYE